MFYDKVISSFMKSVSNTNNHSEVISFNVDINISNVKQKKGHDLRERCPCFIFSPLSLRRATAELFRYFIEIKENIWKA